MERLIALDHPDQLADFPATGVLEDFAPDRRLGHKPDRILLVLDGRRQALARCSLWWSATAPHERETLGYIGHYASAGRSSSQMLLLSACQHLKTRACSLAVGPLDGDTWHAYRFVTDRGTLPPFFLEPVNPPEWPSYWHEAGFEPLAEYSSALNTDLEKSIRDFRRTAKRYATQGIKVRQLHMASYEQELMSIYRISARAFANNFLYTPIAENDFLALYAPLKPCIRPELVWLAEGERGPLAFVFAVPDHLQARRGETIDTVVIKTMAAVPSASTQGLGAFLVAQAMPAYHDLGYRQAVHALMHERNPSQSVSRHQPNVRTIRRYTLFAKRLGEAS